MRVMVLLKSTPELEAGKVESQAERDAMDKYNEALVDAGIRLDAQGLRPSSMGVRVAFTGTSSSITDGPFAETKELLRGFWIWQVETMDEAVEWAKRAPLGASEQIELRPIVEAKDFGEAFTPELQAQEETLRERVKSRQ
jgi:hypothetical protein